MKKSIKFFVIIFLFMIVLNSCLSAERISYTARTLGYVMTLSTIDEDIKKAPSNVPVVLKIPYQKSGKPYITETYVNGKRNGNYEKYFENGRIMLKGTFKDDEPINLWELYNESGELLKKGSYEEIKAYKN